MYARRVQFNSAQREIVVKIVYYGPPLSGKTTNLQALHQLLGAKTCGRLTTLDTADDRTLFFDLLPLIVNSASGFRIKFKLFTVPGQVIHAATRRLVLQGADGIVFVADSQLEEAKNNNEFWKGMKGHISENGLDPGTIPTVIQFNKRDLPNIRSDQDLDKIIAKSKEPVFKATAIQGDGVLETLHGLLILLFKDLQQHYDFERKFKVSLKDILRSVFANAARPQPGEDPQ